MIHIGFCPRFFAVQPRNWPGGPVRVLIPPGWRPLAAKETVVAAADFVASLVRSRGSARVAEWVPASLSEATASDYHLAIRRIECSISRSVCPGTG